MSRSRCRALVVASASLALFLGLFSFSREFVFDPGTRITGNTILIIAALVLWIATFERGWVARQAG